MVTNPLNRERMADVVADEVVPSVPSLTESVVMDQHLTLPEMVTLLNAQMEEKLNATKVNANSC